MDKLVTVSSTTSSYLVLNKQFSLVNNATIDLQTDGLVGSNPSSSRPRAQQRWGYNHPVLLLSGTTTLSLFNLRFLLARVLATLSADAAGGDLDVQFGCGCDDAVPLLLSSPS